MQVRAPVAALVQSLSTAALVAAVTVAGGNAATRNQHRAVPAGTTVGQYYVY